MSKRPSITPILQRRKLRHKEIRQFVQGPIVRQQYIQDSRLSAGPRISGLNRLGPQPCSRAGIFVF